MDMIREQLARLQSQLAGLTASQKMLAAALVAVMALTVLWWADKAAQPSMLPVLDQALVAEEIGPIRSALSAAGIPFEVQGDRVMVPAGRQLEAISVMGMGNALPRNPSAAFERMVEKMSAWDSSLKTDEYLREAKRRYLCEIITGFPGVSQADVVLGMSTRRRIGKQDAPTAAIALSTRDGRKTADREMIEGAVNIVCGLVPGLERSAVKVTVNGFRQDVADPDGHMAAANDLFEQRARLEQHYEQKIYNQLDFIPQLVASVTVEIDNTRREMRSHRVDPDQVVAAPRSETSQLSESKSTSAPTEPGAIPNTGGSLWDEMYGGGESTSSETTEVDNYVDHSRTEEHSFTPAGTPKVVSAAVRVPWSYVAAEWKRLNPGVEEEPTPDQLTEVEQRVLDTVRADIVACTNMADPSGISVNTYADAAGPAAGEAATEVAGFTLPGGIEPLALLTTHGKSIVLTLLAAGAVFAVLRMVSKSGPTVTTEIPDLHNALATLRGEMAIGEVGEEATIMDAQDADPETIEAKQMVEQVQQLVGDNPEAAANLVRRWLDD